MREIGLCAFMNSGITSIHIPGNVKVLGLASIGMNSTLKNVQVDEGVEIFGDHLPVTVLSDALGTIPYEVLTGISNRVQRIYIQE